LKSHSDRVTVTVAEIKDKFEKLYHKLHQESIKAKDAGKIPKIHLQQVDVEKLALLLGFKAVSEMDIETFVKECKDRDIQL